MRGRALLAAALAAGPAWGCARKVPPALFSLPEFTMSSVNRPAVVPFGRRDLLGRVWVADFIFTSCGGPCPLLTERMAQLGKRLPPAVGLLTVSVDPANDTASRLREYARQRGADPDRWVFLRGTVPETYRLLFAGFRLPMSTRPDSPPESRVLHSTRFVLVDKDGGVRGFYEGLSDVENDLLARRARRLSKGDS